ncbi:hypothetical protein BB559_001082 [Furculomyces boomerangus]|uniref:Uncharacterized protein n=2 Tax=Harpellales TaxID=61421 RepID=A0A2T9Z358_9FUNG|nr:hypothetical protein BB559_001082 [Furculomyces boomerangus]PWA03779.1 hypothetical protein BB558_000034 [Smittium angustum]
MKLIKNISVLLPALAFVHSVTVNQYFVIFGTKISDIGNSVNSSSTAKWFGRFSNGPVWNEYTSYYNNYTLMNQAISDSYVDNTIFNNFKVTPNTTPSIIDQISSFTTAFKTLFNVNAIRNDIAVIQLSLNDLSLYSTLSIQTGTTDDSFTDKLVARVYKAVEMVRDLGYKKIIVTDIPEIKYLPIYRSTPANVSKMIQDLTVECNKKLFTAISNFSIRNKNQVTWVKTFSFDAIFQMSVDPTIPQLLGITNTATACIQTINNVTSTPCSNSNAYFFNDETSVNTRVHALAGAIMAELINNSSINYSTQTIIPLIGKYNITTITTTNSFMFPNGIQQNGVLNISEFTFNQALNNEVSITNLKNSLGNNSKICLLSILLSIVVGSILLNAIAI